MGPCDMRSNGGVGEVSASFPTAGKPVTSVPTSWNASALGDTLHAWHGVRCWPRERTGPDPGGGGHHSPNHASLCEQLRPWSAGLENEGRERRSRGPQVQRPVTLLPQPCFPDLQHCTPPHGSRFLPGRLLSGLPRLGDLLHSAPPARLQCHPGR